MPLGVGTLERETVFSARMTGVFDRQLRFIERHWRWLALLAWALFAGWLISNKWGQIIGFVLSDTDDNMRMSQVRAWLNGGQGWYDLRNYRLNWPDGANMHWSRLVDLPLAGLILLGRTFMTGPHAEQLAITIAPLLPLALLIIALCLTIRRLIHPAAWPLAVICLFFSGAAMGQFAPTRIDHHGWQLAFLALAIAGIADPKRARGGATLGIATALSLAIGLESLIYIALAGGTMVLFWVAERDERRRLATYAASLAGGSALAFVIFASYANRLPVCDALSPVWLSDALLAGAMLVGLAWWSPAKWQTRLIAAVGAGIILAGFHAMVWPHCLSRLEGVSDEVYTLWLSHVREARPIYRVAWRTMVFMLALPVTAVAGFGLLAWHHRDNADLLRRSLGVALPAMAALGLLFWQVRAGPAAQILAIPGAVALIMLLAPLAFASKHAVVRVIGTSLAVLAGAGALVPLIVDNIPEKKETARDRTISKSNASCGSLRAMRPIAKLPAATIFTFGDLAPRLITVTHHRSNMGPYHRNGEAIADSMKIFRGTPDNARAILGKYHADYLLTCPMMSQSTVFMSEAPKGFYAQLAKGQVPAWLDPVDLGPKSPLKLWRVKP
ncbi:MAG: AcrB/AcrD/AcrF family protein [Sphingomonas bacterium]|nr:AcrB/AcrD/AcrF family protein [Sphingomonas bacterium]